MRPTLRPKRHKGSKGVCQRLLSAWLRSPAISSIVILTSLAFVVIVVHAADRTWNNTGTDFNTAGSWTGGVPGTGDRGVFATAATTQPNLSSSLTIQGLGFTAAGASGYNLTSSNTAVKLTLTNTGTGTSSAINAANTSGTNTIDAPLIMGGSSASTQLITQSASGGALVINGVISSTNSPTVSFSVTGTSSITLNGANTYTGATNAAGGSLGAGTILAMGNDSAFSTGTFTLSSGIVLTAVNGSRTIANATTWNANGSVGGSNDLTFSGNFSTGTGALTRTLSVNNSGLTTLSGNIFLAPDNATTRTLVIGGTGTVAISGVMANNNAGNTTASNFQLNSSGILTLSGTNTHTGTTTLTAGTLVLGNKDAFGSSSNVAWNGVSTSASTNLSGANAIANTGSFGAAGNIFTGSNNLELSGVLTNSVTAQTLTNNISAGTLTLSNTLNLSNGSTNRTVTFSGTGNTLISAVIANGSTSTSNLSKSGVGLLTLSGVNTYSGSTTISAGTLALSSSGSIASSPIIEVAGGATFDVSALTTALTLASGQDLRAPGSASSGTIATASGKGLTTAGNSELLFTAFDPPVAPLTITGAGTVAVSSGDSVTVTVSNGGVALGTGDYVLIAKGSSGGVTGTAPTLTSVGGDGIAIGKNASILIVDQQLILSVDSPTAVRMSNFTATAFNDGVMLEWQTGFESNNLGYNLYRLQNGQRTLVTPSIIAGSALMTRAGSAFRSGFAYGWFDSGGTVGAQYMLEAIDLNGSVDAFAPQYAAKGSSRYAPRKGRSTTFEGLADLAATGSGAASQRGWPAAAISPAVTTPANPANLAKQSGLSLEARTAVSSLESTKSAAESESLKTQHLIGSQPGVKLQVRRNGYYRISQPQLVAAGLDTSANPNFLQLYVNGEERPMRVNSNGDNGASLEPADSVEFYGTGVDALTTDTQTYYLVSGTRPGLRIRADRKKGAAAWLLKTEIGTTFDYTVETKERIIYLPGLINGDVDNIFGRPVNATPVTQTLAVRDLGSNLGSNAPAQLEVILQGYTAVAHQVQVQLNGSYVGTINFNGAAHQSAILPLAPGLIQEGNNSVTLNSSGQTDLSFLDAIRVTYPRRYLAEGDSLNFSVGANTTRVSGFTTSAIRVIDITQPNSPRELAPRITQVGNSYEFQISGTGSGSAAAPRNFIAIADNLIGQPLAVTADQPSSLHEGLGDTDMVIISHDDLRESVEPLAAWRRSQGLKVAVVDVEDIYDEFSYGSHKPEAVRDFLAWTVSHSVTPPRYVLLAGDSSWDPRNYLGQGYHDYVPTKMIGTYELETASDDWLADYDADGVADLAVGRLPARTASQISAMVGKIITYDQERAMEGPLRGALLVSDNGFETQTGNVSNLLASSTTVQTLNRSVIGNDNSMRTQVVDAINQGPAIVNYFGHGSTGVWTGAGLLNRDNAATLTNGSRPSLFVLMTCLNGYSHEAAIDSLAEVLMKNPQGGAFAVWASSGQTVPFGQAVMNEQLYQMLLGGQSMRLGDAIRQAKLSTGDLDVRRTWMLFGDPTMKLR